MRKNSQIENIAAVLHEGLNDKVKTKGAKAPGACVQVALLSVDAVDSKEVIKMMEAAAQPDPHELAELFYNTAKTNASGMDVRAKFEIVFFYEGSDSPRKPYPFTIMSTVALGEHGTEEATAKGIVRQMMAEKNEVLRMCFAQMNVMQDHTVSLLDSSTRRLQVEIARADQAVDERNAAIDYIVGQRHANESKVHEYRMAEIEKQNDNKLKQMFLEMAPAGVNALMNKPVLPESMASTAAIKMLLNAADKMRQTPEGQAVLMPFIMALPPEVQTVLMSMGTQMQQQRAEEEAKSKAALDLAGQVTSGRPETPLAMSDGSNGTGRLQ
jgi:hypothetical protein